MFMCYWADAAVAAAADEHDDEHDDADDDDEMIFLDNKNSIEKL